MMAVISGHADHVFTLKRYGTFTVAYYFLSEVLGVMVRCCNAMANHSVTV